MGSPSLPSRPDDVLREIIQVVPGYGISYAAVLTGAPAMVPNSLGIYPEANGLSNGKTIESAHDHLFSSGTMGRYSSILTQVQERTPRTEPDLL